MILLSFLLLAKQFNSKTNLVNPSQGILNTGKSSGSGSLNQGPLLEEMSPKKLKASYSQYKTFFDYTFRSSHYSNFVSSHNVATPFTLNCGGIGEATAYHLFLKQVLRNLCLSEGFNSTPCTGCGSQLLFTSELYSFMPSDNFTLFLTILRNSLLEYRNQTFNLNSQGFSLAGSSNLSFPYGLKNGTTVALMMEAVVPMEYFPGSSQDTLVEEIKSLLTQIRSTTIPGSKDISSVKARMFLYFLMPKSNQSNILITNKINEIILAANDGKMFYATNLNQELIELADPVLMELEVNAFTIQAANHLKQNWTK